MMVDHGTVAIAAITALAGWGGSVIAGGFRMRELRKAHGRDDSALMRTKVEELFVELDAIQAAASQQIVTAMGILDRRDPAGATIEKFNLGRIRSLVTLYFPNLARMVATYDAKCGELIRTLRTDLQDPDMDKITAMYGHVAQAGQLTSNLCEELRGALTDEAEAIGASIRGAGASIQLH